VLAENLAYLLGKSLVTSHPRLVAELLWLVLLPRYPHRHKFTNPALIGRAGAGRFMANENTAQLGMRLQVIEWGVVRHSKIGGPTSEMGTLTSAAV
jgi:hypothetical protein